MNLESLFQLVNTAILPAWLLLFFLPHWKYTQKFIHAIWIPCILGLFYAYLIFSSNEALPADANLTTLSGIMSMLSDPQAFLAGWIHYIIFDLFVGAWIVRDAKRMEIKHLLIVPCLIFTLMLGPLGLTLYLLLKVGLKQKTSLVEG